MDREEFHAKMEMIDDLVYSKDHRSALELVESIDWAKVKDAHALYTAGEVYASNRRYQESKEVFLMAYDRLPVRKNILYRLVEVSIKTGELEDAWEYYERFLKVSPNDDVHYVLRYKICSAQGEPLEEQIQILEEYKERDYTERWSYELAKLYYKAGEEKKCIETCDDIVLWFSEGGYVKKALELKQRLTNLTPRQQDIYETMVGPEILGSSGGQEGGPPALEEEVIKSGGMDDEDNMVPIVENNDSLQEKISKGIKDIFAGIVKEWEEEDDLLESYPGTPKINIADVIPVQQVEESIREKEEAEQSQDGTEERMEEGSSQKEPEETIGAGSIQEEPEEKIGLGQTQDGTEIDIETEAQGTQNETEEQIETEQIQKEPEISGFDTSKLPKLELPEFNLEAVILSAAEKQGIEVPDVDMKEEGSGDGNGPQEELQTADAKAGDEIEKEIRKEDDGELGQGSDKIPEQDPGERSGEDPEQDPGKDPGGSEEKPEEGSEKIEEGLQSASGEDEEEKSPSIAAMIQPEGEIRPQEEILSEEESLIQFIESKDAQAEADQDTIVPRNPVLDDTELKLFSYFSSIPGMKEQLVEVLADVQMAASDKTSRTGNIIVMGNKRTGKTKLVDSLIKAVCRELHMPAARIAVVEAAQLNGQDMPKIVSKLSGGFLAIKKVSQLAADSVFQLDQALEFRTDGLTVILEDEKIGMRKFIAKYQKFAKKFTSTVNIPVFTNDELVHFAKIYADEMGYVMDTMGVLALYNLIGDNQKEDEPMTIGTVKDMMDTAITKAESSHRKFQRSISKKRFDDEGKIILYEKDFK